MLGKGWRIAMWGSIGVLLLVPLVAMQFTKEVNWTAFDFAFAAVMLGSVCLGFELALRKSGNVAYRAAAGLALLSALLLVWINGAVGIIGDEGNPANLMFAVVLAFGLVGGIVARFEADGMARATGVMAATQAIVGVIALIEGSGSTGPIYPMDVIGLTGFFTCLWLLSAWLFRQAARQQPPSVAEGMA
jgi:hypothetical protein